LVTRFVKRYFAVFFYQTKKHNKERLSEGFVTNPVPFYLQTSMEKYLGQPLKNSL
jgi:hypothetical protein